MAQLKKLTSEDEIAKSTYLSHLHNLTNRIEDNSQ